MTTIHVIGNVGRADLTFTPSGKALLKGSVAVNRRRFDRAANEWADVGTDWHDFALWGDKAEAAAEVVTKGVRVIVSGELESRQYEKDGGQRTAWEIKASEVGVIPRGAARSQGQRATSAASVGNDPWATDGPAPF